MLAISFAPNPCSSLSSLSSEIGARPRSCRMRTVPPRIKASTVIALAATVGMNRGAQSLVKTCGDRNMTRDEKSKGEDPEQRQDSGRNEIECRQIRLVGFVIHSWCELSWLPDRNLARISFRHRFRTAS